MKSLKLLQRNLLYILICAVYAISCTVNSTDINEYKKYGRFIDCYHYYEFGRVNKLVFYNDSTGVIKEVKVSEGIYYHFKTNECTGHVIK